MARTVMSFDSLKMGTVFILKEDKEATRYIKVVRPNGKLGAIKYDAYLSFVNSDFKYFYNELYFYPDCRKWDCIIYDTEPEIGTKPKTREPQSKPYLLINKPDAEAFRISEENAKLFEYLSDYVDFDDFEVIRASSIKEF